MHHINRRTFVKSAALTAVSTAIPSTFVHTQSKSQDPETIVGDGDFQFKVKHHWPDLPSKYSWQVTHNVAVDDASQLYVIHEGHLKKKDHPAIFVFDETGKFIRAFGKQFQGGGHGIEVRQEGSEEFLYVCAYQSKKTFAKLTLKGETVWQKFAPMQSEVYAKDEDTKPTGQWGRDRFMPTNFAFLKDGSFFLADGYGSFQIHHYDKDANWKSCFGGQGKGEGKFNTPHGIWTDYRQPQPTLIICDRGNHTLQRVTLDGEHIETLQWFGLPANIDIQNDWVLVPELHARLTILGSKNQVVARLGDDVERIKNDKGNTIRKNESKWTAGKFVHPHDACFDKKGNIFVAEWVNSGRVTKLEKIS